VREAISSLRIPEFSLASIAFRSARIFQLPLGCLSDSVSNTLWLARNVGDFRMEKLDAPLLAPGLSFAIGFVFIALFNVVQTI